MHDCRLAIQAGPLLGEKGGEGACWRAFAVKQPSQLKVRSIVEFPPIPFDSIESILIRPGQGLALRRNVIERSISQLHRAPSPHMDEQPPAVEVGSRVGGISYAGRSMVRAVDDEVPYGSERSPV